jgi:hypothetical protein
MLSNLMTAKSLEQKPASHESDSTVNLSKDCRPNTCNDCNLFDSFEREEDDLPVIAITLTLNTGLLLAQTNALMLSCYTGFTFRDHSINKLYNTLVFILILI